MESLNLIAACGLYCGNCRSYLNGKCSGCEKNENAKWCKVRTCCQTNHYASCAECTVADPHECKKLNNLASKIFAVFFRSDRLASIRYIKEKGGKAYVEEMEKRQQMVFKKN